MLPRISRGWLAVLALLLFALSWQSFLAQTHGHPVSMQSDVASKVIAAPKAGDEAPSGQKSHCRICAELAHVTPALLSASVVLASPPRIAVFPTETRIAAYPPQKPARRWQSRAPPLQA